MAWFLFIAGYIISPMYPEITSPQEGFFGDENIELVKASRILIWGAASCLIAGLMAAAGAILKRYTLAANLISVGILIIATFASVILISPIFFVVI